MSPPVELQCICGQTRLEVEGSPIVSRGQTERVNRAKYMAMPEALLPV